MSGARRLGQRVKIMGFDCSGVSTLRVATKSKTDQRLLAVLNLTPETRWRPEAGDMLNIFRSDRKGCRKWLKYIYTVNFAALPENQKQVMAV